MLFLVGKLDLDARVELVNLALSHMRSALSLSAPQQEGAGSPAEPSTDAASRTRESSGGRWVSRGAGAGGVSGATKLDVVNVATFMHRVSRVVAHGGLSGARDRIQYLDVFQVRVASCMYAPRGCAQPSQVSVMLLLLSYELAPA